MVETEHGGGAHNALPRGADQSEPTAADDWGVTWGVGGAGTVGVGGVNWRVRHTRAGGARATGGASRATGTVEGQVAGVAKAARVPGASVHGGDTLLSKAGLQCSVAAGQGAVGLKEKVVLSGLSARKLHHARQRRVRLTVRARVAAVGTARRELRHQPEGRTCEAATVVVGQATQSGPGEVLVRELERGASQVEVSCVIFPRSIGIVPVRLQNAKSSTPSMVRLLSTAGIEPTRSFPPRERALIWGMPANHSGTRSAKRFAPKPSFWSFRHAINPSGIRPVSLL